MMKLIMGFMQSSREKEPWIPLISPFPQVVHLTVALFSAYVPKSQFKHTELFAAEYVPTGQARHIGILGLSAKYPGSQGMHW
jgi:hypothetical protein